VQLEVFGASTDFAPPQAWSSTVGRLPLLLVLLLLLFTLKLSCQRVTIAAA
jgi:hypothetical protein